MKRKSVRRFALSELSHPQCNLESREDPEELKMEKINMILIDSVKHVYNDHPRDQKIEDVIGRWSEVIHRI